MVVVLGIAWVVGGGVVCGAGVTWCYVLVVCASQETGMCFALSADA
jgi:hypothetical protein